MKSLQRDKFLAGEGDAYFNRNPIPAEGDSDPVITAIVDIGYQPEKVLEIGCGCGSRLREFRRIFNAQCWGIDPSRQAVKNARELGFLVKVGTAERIEFLSRQFDLVIFGFCLYLTDPHHHFIIAAKADRVLIDGGLLVILDFLLPSPFMNEYKHSAGLYSHKMQWSGMFSAHPSYRLIARHWHCSYDAGPDGEIAVDVLRKDVQTAFPLNPWRPR